MQAETLARQSGKAFKPNAALADDKVGKFLTDSGERLGSLAQAARELQTQAEELAAAEKKAPGGDNKAIAAKRKAQQASQAALAQSKAAEAARRELAGVVSQLEKQLKDRRETA